MIFLILNQFIKKFLNIQKKDLLFLLMIYHLKKLIMNIKSLNLLLMEVFKINQQILFFM